MTAASFALLQSFLYLFSARIGCRAFQKRHYFRSALSRKSHQTRGGVTARAVIFPFTATAFCADWLSGLPKIRSFPFCSEPQVPSDARRSHSACCDFSLYRHSVLREFAVGLPQKHSFPVRSEPQVPSDARRCHSACCKLTFIFKASCAIIAARPPRLDYAVSEHGVGNL